MATVLCVDEVEDSNQSRAAVVRTTGCIVTETTSAGARGLLACRKFDLLLLGHTLADEDLTDLIHAASLLTPQPQVVVLDNPFARNSLAHAGEICFDSFEGPHALAELVCRLLGLNAPVHNPLRRGTDAIAPTPVALINRARAKRARHVANVVFHNVANVS